MGWYTKRWSRIRDAFSAFVGQKQSKESQLIVKHCGQIRAKVCILYPLARFGGRRRAGEFWSRMADLARGQAVLRVWQV